jgi:hypothetical protein
MKNENKNNHTNEKSEDVESVNQIDKINLAKMRLSELENEETKLFRRAEKVSEKYEHVPTSTPFIFAIDLFIAVIIFSAIFYHIWRRELPDALNFVIIVIGIIISLTSFNRLRQKFSERQQIKQIEKELKIISNAKAKVEHLIEAGQTSLTNRKLSNK